MEIAKVMNNKLLIKERGNQMRRKVVAGNWKMNMLPNEAIDFIEKLTEKGAYTGEISGQMLKCIGVEYVIIGHSERRQYFAEIDETVNKKVKSALLNGLKPIICVGETLDQRESGKQEEIITNQTHLALEGLNENQLQNVMIAYEPIWAIGTGKTATAEDANNAIKSIRKQIEKDFGKTISENIIILYGGSVKSENCSELFSMSDIDGGLVGGASLKVDEFAKIVSI